MRQLFSDIHEYDGVNLYHDCLLPWLNSNGDSVKNWLNQFRGQTEIPPASSEDLWDLYALSRINETLLLKFQKENIQGAWPQINLAEYISFFSALGFDCVSKNNFNPFYHEVATVNQSSASRVNLTAEVWPCLMLGNMLFSRGGVEVESHVRLLNKSIAENSVLYWSYRRKNRQSCDQSHGWGSNSQWRTNFRRDYVIGKNYWLNVDAAESIDKADLSKETLSVQEFSEVILYRCAVRCDKDCSDLYPFNYKLIIPI